MWLYNTERFLRSPEILSVVLSIQQYCVHDGLSYFHDTQFFIILLFREFFTPALADGFSLEFEW